MKTTEKMELLNRELNRAWNEAFDRGAEQHKSAPNLLLAEVWRIAMHHLEPDRVAVQYFVEGYSVARRQRDEYEQEKEGAT